MRTPFLGCQSGAQSTGFATAPIHETMGSVQALRMRAAALGADTIVVVFGSSVADLESGELSDGLLDAAVKCLARPSVVVVNGGYMGSMASTAQRVRDAGGIAIGVTCANLSDAVAAEYFDVLLPAPDHWSRLRTLVEAADAFLVLPGGIGTAVEIASVIWCADRQFTPTRPLLFLGGSWKQWLSHSTGCEFALRDAKTVEAVTFAESVPDVERFFSAMGDVR